VTPDGAHARHREQQIRRLLAEHADRIVPADGLAVIRARIARRPWWRRLIPARTNGAPVVETGTPPNTTAEKEPTMPTIIQRHARDLHAGDVITADPDHGDRPVRWRVTRPPVRTRDGEYALTDVTDLATGQSRVTYYRVLTSLSVEPVGGAA
jgi:hypothetical protein